MRALEVYLNGCKLCVAGVDEAGVVTSMLTWVIRAKSDEPEMIELCVGGLISRTDTHVDWAHRILKSGDEVRIVVSEKPRVSKPKSIRAEGASVRRKHKFGKMKKTTVFILGLMIGSLISVFAISVIRMPAEVIARTKDLPVIGSILPESISAETAKEIALEVIRVSDHGATAIHNSIGDHAGNIRSILTSYNYRMRHLMLSDAVSEEVRLCYALHSIDYSYMRTEWNVKRYMLAARLMQIQKEASESKKTAIIVTDRAAHAPRQ